MLRVSGVSARSNSRVCRCRTPRRAAIAADPALFEIAATGGDDYELLAAVPPGPAPPSRRAAAAAGVAVDARRRGAAGVAPPRFIGRDGREVAFARGSFSHF